MLPLLFLLLLLTLDLFFRFDVICAVLASRRRRARHGHRSPKKPCARRNNRKPDWVAPKVLWLYSRDRTLSYARLALTFNRLYGASRSMTVSIGYVYYTVRDHRYEVLALRADLKRRPPKPVAQGLEWGLDLTGKTDVAGRVHSILAIIDHGTRLPMRLAVLANKSTWTILGHLFLAIGRYGLPRVLRTDNEAMFVSPLFATVVGRLGIDHQRIDKGCPWMNGRVERFFGTLKAPLNHWRVASRVELERALGLFHEWYAYVRPHSNLGGATPWEAWCGIDPYRTAASAAEWFEAWHGLLAGYRIRR